MCNAVKEYAEKYGRSLAKDREEQTKVNLVGSLMKNMKLSLDQALTALNIDGDERAFIAKQLKQ